MIDIAFMWHYVKTVTWLHRHVTYMWRVTCSIRWICNYLRNSATYVVLVRVDSQLITTAHSIHMMCISSFLYIARCTCIWYRANIFKIFFPELNECYFYTETNNAFSCIKPWLGQYDILEANYCNQKDCKFNYMSTLCLVSFLSTALHILTVYNFTCSYSASFKKGAFFLHRSSPEKWIAIFSQISLDT